MDLGEILENRIEVLMLAWFLDIEVPLRLANLLG